MAGGLVARSGQAVLVGVGVEVAAADEELEGEPQLGSQPRGEPGVGVVLAIVKGPRAVSRTANRERARAVPYSCLRP